MNEWVTVHGILRQGYHVASGPSADYPYGALERQRPIFLARGFDLADSALRVEVMAWLRAGDFNEFADLRGELYLAFMEIVERNGSGFAFPTRTVHLVTPPPPRP